MVKVISLGGSIVAPAGVDVDFLHPFTDLIRSYLASRPEVRLIFVVGGGGAARTYQNAYRSISDSPIEAELDWIGIAATRLNGQLLHALFCTDCPDPVVTDPTADFEFRGRVLIGAGWKPGFSTDFDAVLLAERFAANEVINLSNIEKVFTADPRKDPSARPIDRIDWNGFQTIVGSEWQPGANYPFDPVASKKAAELGLKVIVASGRNLENLRSILEGNAFIGTEIGPD